MDIISEFENGDVIACIDGNDISLHNAAHDLLTASEAFISELDSGDNFMAWEETKAKLRAAITKAKGN